MTSPSFSTATRSTASDPNHELINSASIETLRSLCKSVKEIITSPSTTLSDGRKLVDVLTSEQQGRWKRYWADPTKMPAHPDMNTLGHLHQLQTEVENLCHCMDQNDQTTRIQFLLSITGWIHDLGELDDGDELYQSITAVTRGDERKCFERHFGELFGNLPSAEQDLIRALYSSVALPIKEGEAHTYLHELFKAVEELRHVRTGLEVGFHQPADVQANLLSTSVLYYHEAYFVNHCQSGTLLRAAFAPLFSTLLAVLQDKGSNSNRTSDELRAELELERKNGRRHIIRDCDTTPSFDGWHALVNSCS